MLHTVELGFLSHHRSGIIFPQRLELYLGDDPGHLALACTLDLPEGPAAREIWRQDFGFRPGCTARCVRVVARRYARMPGWCCYKGVPDVLYAGRLPDPALKPKRTAVLKRGTLCSTPAVTARRWGRCFWQPTRPG